MNPADEATGKGGSVPRVLVREGEKAKAKPPVRPWGEPQKFRLVGWLGVVLTLAALSDYALALYPFGMGSPEWELATIGSIVQGLPLFSIGVAAIWLAAGGLGERWMLLSVAWGLFVAAAVLLGSLLLFATDIPLAIKATQDVSRIGIEKLVVRTLFLGLLFGAAYVIAGVLALRQARGNTPKESLA